MSDKPASRSDESLTEAQIETLIEESGGYWREDHFVIVGSELSEMLQAAARAASLSEQQRWIPVSERVPERQYDVMVSDGKFVGIGDCCKGHLWNATTIPGPVTHWMPLPASPAERN